MTTGEADSTRPISRAMASAVCGWSPVTMITWMPAEPAAGDGLGHLGARRVVQADEARQAKPRLAGGLARGEILPGEGEDAKPLLGHGELGGGHALPGLVAQAADRPALLDAVAQGKHDLGAPLQ